MGPGELESREHVSLLIDGTIKWKGNLREICWAEEIVPGKNLVLLDKHSTGM